MFSYELTWMKPRNQILYEVRGASDCNIALQINSCNTFGIFLSCTSTQTQPDPNPSLPYPQP